MSQIKTLDFVVISHEKSFKELCRILRKQFTHKIFVHKKWLEFYSLCQSDQEIANEWFARIKSKAINCKFGISLKEVLKDKFVTRLCRGPISDRMCKKD